jgi:hypothetical protein
MIHLSGNFSPSQTGIQTAVCPDLLRLGDLGPADCWRGRLVRAFFRLLRVLTGV